MCQGGEIGRRTGLKIPRWQHCVGSSPTLGTIYFLVMMNPVFELSVEQVSKIKKRE